MAIGDQRTIIATVRRPHGVHGEVVATLWGFTVEDLAGVTTVYAISPKGEQVLHLIGARGTPTHCLLSFEEIEDRDAAEALRRVRLAAPREALPPLEEDEFYVQDLIGLTVETPEGERLGEVRELIYHPGQDTLVVQREDEEEILIPFVSAWVMQVDLKKQRIIAHQPRYS